MATSQTMTSIGQKVALLGVSRIKIITMATNKEPIYSSNGQNDDKRPTYKDKEPKYGSNQPIYTYEAFKENMELSNKQCQDNMVFD